MPHWKKHFDKELFGSWDLEDGNGKFRDSKPLTIKTVTAGELTGQSGKKDKKPIVTFEETTKKLALNATNCKIIAAMYDSNNTDDWVGKQIVLYVTKVDAFGTTTDALRVRPEKPSRLKAAK